MKWLTTTAIITAMMMALSLTTVSTASAGDNRQMAGALIGATAGGLLGSTSGRATGRWLRLLSGRLSAPE